MQKRTFLDFKWPLADGVLEEWVTLELEEEKKKLVVVSRSVEFRERKFTWRDKLKKWINGRLA